MSFILNRVPKISKFVKPELYYNSIVGSPVTGSDGTLYIGTISDAFYAFNDVAANFIPNTTNINDPLNIQFTDESTGTQKSGLWTFGDGTSSTQQNPAHT